MESCHICGPPPFSFGLRHTICAACYEGARSMVDFLNNIESDLGLGMSKNPYGFTANNPIKGIDEGFKLMKEMKERLGFLDGQGVAFRDGLHTDILVMPGSGPPIPAHKAILASRSEIFRPMLGSDDECKAPAEDTISLPELSYDELWCLLEFLYCGDLADEKAEKHAHSLLIAADKYDIPFLKRFCEHRILKSLGPSNALEVLEVSDVCSNRTLKEHAMNSVVKHAEDVVFSAKYDAFALKNVHLCVEITRALQLEMKKREQIYAGVTSSKKLKINFNKP